MEIIIVMHIFHVIDPFRDIIFFYNKCGIINHHDYHALNKITCIYRYMGITYYVATHFIVKVGVLSTNQ
jgi:hypothetical protein